MMCKWKMRSAKFYFVAAVFLACYLAETVDCYRRRKPLRIDVRKEPELTKPVGLREGEILFGKSLKGPKSQPMDGTNQRSSNSSVEDETEYQADAPVLPYGHEHMDSWNQMTKSLQCGANQMHFKVIGPGQQHFAVDPLNGPSMPFPLVPPSCGYNIRRFPYYMRVSIPYSGCNVLKEGGHYRLPLMWRGIPVVLSCQGPPPAGDGQNWLPWSSKYHIPPPPQFPFPPYPWHPPAGDDTIGQPATTQPDPVGWPVDPWPIGQHTGVKHWDHWHFNPTPTTAAPTTMPQMPHPYHFPWYHPHHYHHHPHYSYLYHGNPYPLYPYWQNAQDPTPDSEP